MKYYLILFLLCCGCAKPNYQVTPMQQGPQAVGDEGFRLFSNYLGLHVKIVFEKGPNSGEENLFTILFHTSTDATPVAVNEAISVVLWMPSMGHGSSPVKVQKVADGVYRASQVYFIMPGDWEIRLQIKNQETSNVVEQITHKLDI